MAAFMGLAAADATIVLSASWSWRASSPNARAMVETRLEGLAAAAVVGKGCPKQGWARAGWKACQLAEEVGANTHECDHRPAETVDIAVQHGLHFCAATFHECQKIAKNRAPRPTNDAGVNGITGMASVPAAMVNTLGMGRSQPMKMAHTPHPGRNHRLRPGSSPSSWNRAALV